jgi:outer membrane protein OmpA-like peptidoglycan-associated protein
MSLKFIVSSRAAKAVASCFAAALAAASLTGCATVEAEVPTVEQPVHANRIGQVPDGHRLRYAVCLTCPERTVKTLGREPQTAATPSRVTLTSPTTPLTPRALVATVNFDFASSAITAHTRAALDSLRPLLGQASDIHVTGFTDDLGPMGINTRLASERGKAVLQALAGPAGPLQADGLSPPVLTAPASGYTRNAAGRPLCCYVAPNVSEEGRASNRRAELTFTVQRTAAVDRALQKAAAVAAIKDATRSDAAAAKTAATAADQPHAHRQ